MQTMTEARVSTILNVIAGARKRPSESPQVSKSTEVITERHINTRKKNPR